jgi:acetylglutamate kinase
MTVTTPLTVKLGGVAGGHGASLEVIAHHADASCVVVHGGGAELADWQRRLAIEPRVHEGLRVTDPASLEIAVAVLAGLINTRLVAAFEAAGRRAIGLTGADGGLLTLKREPTLGEVGRPVGAKPAVLEHLIAGGLLPVVSSIGSDGAGALLNVNADEAASAIAASRGGRLLLCSDVAGVLREGTRISQLSSAEATVMIEDGSALSGMVPKLRAAIGAAEAGCEVRIIDGRSPEDVAAALAGEAVGTLISASVTVEASA